MAQKALTLVEIVQLTLTSTTYYTTPANTTTQIDSILLNNTTSIARTVKLNIVPSAGSAVAANEAVTRVLVPANAAVTVPQMALQTLKVGEQLFASADLASSVNMRVVGREIQYT